MKVLLTHSYFYRFDPKQWDSSKPYPPLATLLMAAMLREQRHEVSFFDVSFAHASSDILPALEQHKPDVLLVYDDSFNYLSKMCLTNMREAACEMAAFARKQNIRTLIASSDASDHPEFYLKQGFELVVQGEAEETVLDCISGWERKDSLQSLPNLCFFDGLNLIRNPKRPVKTQLDQLPFAAWDLLDVRPYREAWSKHGYFSLNAATTRGCPFKCNWCAKPIYGNRYNSRSPEHVVEELKLMYDKFQFDHIWFCDDIFGLKPGWVKRFAELISEAGLKFKFKIQSRVDLLLQDKTIEELKQAGCDEVWVGAESGSQKILDAMDKGTTVEQIRVATNKMKAAGLKPCFFLQFGYPGENHDDIRATIDMLFELKPWDIGISVSYPLPGTVFYERVKDQLKGKSNWTDSDELLLMFRNTYPPEFYKSLHRYIHRRFRAMQALGHDGAERSFRKILSWFYFKPAYHIEEYRMKRLSAHVEQSL